jgi:acetyl esterase/lipase
MSMPNITLKVKTGVFFWRNMMVPVITAIAGKSFPKGKVTEYAYGDLKDEMLDYIAPGKASEKQTAIVHIHGGAWIAGSKGRFFSKPLMKFSDAGYPVFSLNYPLAPERPHPYMLRSLLKALVWIRYKFPHYESIHLIGDSAGGHLAMMLGIFISNPELPGKLDNLDITMLPKIRSIVDIYGVNDRITWVEDGFPGAKLFLKAYAGEKAGEHNFVSAIPVTPMDVESIDHLPPVFIVGAGKDKLLRSSKIWAERISKPFKDVQFKIYDGADHGFFSFGKGCDELSDDMLAYFGKQDLKG